MFNKLLIIDNIENPAMLINDCGSILHTNLKAQHLLEILHLEGLSDIVTLDGEFNKENYTSEEHVSRELSHGIDIKADIYALSYDKKTVFLYLFEERVFLSENFREIVNAIDEGVAIVDDKERIEYLNCALFRGYEERDFNIDVYIGKNLQQVIHGYGIDYEALAPFVIEKKETVSKNIKYSNGISRTVTGVPLLHEDGNINLVILTLRDISSLMDMEMRLGEIEKYKNKYFNQLEELNKYRNQNKLIYSSLVMEKLLNMAFKVSKTDTPVFITGESGVGKEEFAKYIYVNSNRKDMPFVAINCAAIPSELIESELFGYEKGAFTGAMSTGKKGLFDEGNGGTIFLDEIGEMPWNLQTKLLRVIQEGCFFRVGGNIPIKLDARYISATNLSSEELNKKYRRDLFYRLNTITLNIPPLRERKEDIIPLASHFLQVLNTKYGRNVRITRDVIRLLLERKWPGNVRELKNTIERLIILTDKDIIDINEFEDIMELSVPVYNDVGIQIKEIIPLSEAYQKIEQILIEEAYGKYGTIAGAARALGITPSTIYRKMKEGSVKLDGRD